MFKERFSANKIEPPRLIDLFDVRQREGEPCKDYLDGFCVVSVCLWNPNEEIMVDPFVKGLRTSLFSDSLIRNQAKYERESRCSYRSRESNKEEESERTAEARKIQG